MNVQFICALENVLTDLAVAALALQQMSQQALRTGLEVLHPTSNS